MQTLNFRRDGMKKTIALLDKRRSIGEKIAFGGAFAIFSIYSLTIILMFVWAFLSSLKANREFFSSPFSLPEVWRFSNYVEAFQVLQYKDTNFIGMIFNSLWLTCGNLFLGLMSCSLTGYVFAKYSFRGKAFMYSVAMFSIIVPIFSSGASYYKLVYSLGINDSPMYLITALGGFSMNFIILQGVYRNFSWSYAEACFIDGGGHMYTYFKIMLPMALPIILALGITGFIAGWNDYMTPLLYLEEMPTLAAGLYFYKVESQYASNQPVYLAGALLSALPVLILFAVFQNKVFDKVSIGGLKE